MRTSTLGIGILSIVLLLVPAGVSDASAKSRLTRQERKLQEQTAGERQAGEQSKAAMLSKFKVLDKTPFNPLMKRVFDRLVATPEVSARGFAYEVFLVESDQANALCTPGGKVFVLSGMTTILRNDPDLWAALLGHELAHAVDSDAVQTQKKVKVLGGVRSFFRHVAAFVPGIPNADGLSRVIDRAGTALDLVNPLLQKKFSRDDESEADSQGMLYMARAGFDPAAAIRLHKEFMTRFGDSKALTTFLHTHPRESVRIEQLQTQLEEAKKLAAEPPTRQGNVAQRKSGSDD